MLLKDAEIEAERNYQRSMTLFKKENIGSVIFYKKNHFLFLKFTLKGAFSSVKKSQ